MLSIIRSKLVAVLLGPQGMGIAGLLLSVTTLISGITGMGINVSAVRNIAEANRSDNRDRIAQIVGVVKKLALFTGLLGAVLTIMLSPWLSKITFGDDSYTFSFIALSVTFLLSSFTGSRSVLLQGMRKLSYLAKSNILGTTVGLIFSVPLYYLYGKDGIVPAIIITAFITAFFAYYFAAKLDVPRSKTISLTVALQEGKGMMSMGIMLSLSGIIASASAYILRLFISDSGTLVDVGLYSAGFAIVNTYVGMIFMAMGTDYYPRLSAVAHDVPQANRLVNQQAEMALLILGPILLLFLIGLKFVITILYTAEFLGTINMVQWAVLAIFLKAITWAMGFIFLAKGESKVFFWNELIANTYVLVLNILGYAYFGLEGLGISFLLSFMLSVIQNYLVVRYRYGFIVSTNMITIFCVQFTLAIACMLLMKQMNNAIVYLYVLPLLVGGTIYSWIQLNKRLDIISYARRVLMK